MDGHIKWDGKYTRRELDTRDIKGLKCMIQCSVM